MQFNNRKAELPTHSHYEGGWNAAIRIMEGFGTYTYPDGSEYRGYFKLGRFHGYGTLKLIRPQRFVIKGNFENGHCTYINELKFGDGLEFNGFLQSDGTMDSSNWKYLTKNDRRFHDELRYGIDPNNPYLTAEKRPRNIPMGAYDTSDGTFYPYSGFISIVENTGVQNRSRFVECPEEREWIKKHCRHHFRPKGKEYETHAPNAEFSHQIIKCNIDMFKKDSCLCKGKMDRDRYFGNICPEHFKGMQSFTDTEQFNIESSGGPITPSSSTIESFGYNDEDNCKTETLISAELKERSNPNSVENL